MPPVFAHGRLRLYLLKLLDEAPRHGYEVIRLLEERFHGLYAPSAGTVYPRLAKLEAEGLVTHATEGGRKVYSITEAGRAELAGRSGELADLEMEIRESVSELAAEIREDVRGAAGKLRSEMKAAASRTQTSASAEKEEWRRAAHAWQEQVRRAREDARQARRQAKEAQDRTLHEVQRIAEQVQDQVQEHFARGDWPTGVREGLSELTAQLGGLGGRTKNGAPRPPRPDAAPSSRTAPAKDSAGPERERRWAKDTPSTGDPARDLDRLLDRFRDDVRDAARDHGVTPDQLDRARRRLSSAASEVVALLVRGEDDGPSAPDEKPPADEKSPAEETPPAEDSAPGAPAP